MGPCCWVGVPGGPGGEAGERVWNEERESPALNMILGQITANGS